MTTRHTLLACLLLQLFVAADRSIAEDSPKPKRLLLLFQGPDGHPPTTHEYESGVKQVAKTLSTVPHLTIEISNADGAWEKGPEQLRQTDGAFLFVSQGAKWIQDDPRRFEAFSQLAQRQGGLSVLHWGMGTKEATFIDGFVKLFGGCHGGPDRKYQVVETDLQIVLADHEIASGLRPFRAHDEFYYRLSSTSKVASCTRS